MKNITKLVSIVLLIVVGFLILNDRSLMSKFGNSDVTKPVVVDKTKLLVVSRGIDNPRYTFTLYDLSAKKVISQRIIDLYRNLPASITLVDSKFESFDAFNNPTVITKSGSIYLFFSYGENPHDQFDPNIQMPPFISAVYKTTFDSKDELEQIYTTGSWDRTFYPDETVEIIPSGNGIDNVIYDDQGDKIYFKLTGGLWMTINPLDDKVEVKGKINDGVISNRQVGHINNGNISVLGALFKGKNSSDFGQDWLKLSNYNFESGKLTEKILAKDCHVNINKGSLSPNDKAVVFTCSRNDPLSFSVLDIEKNKIHSLPKQSDYNIYWSGDGSKFLFATKQGGQLYDIATHTFSPFEQRISTYLWEPNTRYLAGETASNLVIYDMQAKELQILDFFDKTKERLYHLQWH